MAVCCMYKSIVDALNMGYNPVYVTQVTGASYNNGEIVICKKCGSLMKYNHQKNYFKEIDIYNLIYKYKKELDIYNTRDCLYRGKYENFKIINGFYLVYNLSRMSNNYQPK